jgi:DNA-3-methyladenine glycosylase I
MTLAQGLFRSEDDGAARCSWCQATPAYQHYHDHEWGFPVTDDRRLFEKICLEGFQSGLSWLTILNKRENFRRAFDQFDAERVARYNQSDVDRLLEDAGIVRHRGKIESTINNAKRVLEMRREFGSLAAYACRLCLAPRTGRKVASEAYHLRSARSNDDQC